MKRRNFFGSLAKASVALAVLPSIVMGKEREETQVEEKTYDAEFLNNGFYDNPNRISIGLFTYNPITQSYKEVSYKGYKRCYTSGPYSWVYNNEGIENAVELSFPQLQDTERVNITHFCVFNTKHKVVHGPLNHMFYAGPGMTPEFGIGALTIDELL